jgi:hypothetical protein
MRLPLTQRYSFLALPSLLHFKILRHMKLGRLGTVGGDGRGVFLYDLAAILVDRRETPSSHPIIPAQFFDTGRLLRFVEAA